MYLSKWVSANIASVTQAPESNRMMAYDGFLKNRLSETITTMKRLTIVPHTSSVNTANFINVEFCFKVLLRLAYREYAYSISK